MKVFCIILLCLLFGYSCSPSNKIDRSTQSSDKISLHEGVWYTNFKNEVFMSCLGTLYPDNLIAAINSVDASSAANLDQLDYRSDVRSVIDSLVGAFIKRPETVWAIENRRVTMNVCLSYRNSTELDSIAIDLYKRVHSK